MTRKIYERFLLLVTRLTLSLVISGALAHAQSTTATLPNMGQTPSPQGRSHGFIPDVPFISIQGCQASQVVVIVVSPLGGDSLRVLISGCNRIYTSEVVSAPPVSAYITKYSNECVFAHDILRSARDAVFPQTANTDLADSYDPEITKQCLNLPRAQHLYSG
jgi:hypothetical protein